MKINYLNSYIFTSIACYFLIACGGKNNMSRATGWGINSKDGGFQYNTEFEDQEIGPGLVFIEGGTYTKGQVQDDVLHDWNNTPTQQPLCMHPRGSVSMHVSMNVCTLQFVLVGLH